MTEDPPSLSAPFTEELLLFQSHLLDAVLQPVVVSDVDGRVIYWNDACEAQYGWTREEALGRDVMEFLSDGDLAAETQSIEGTVRDDDAWAGEMQLRRKDGSVFSAMCTASPIPGPDGELAAVLGIATDLTQLKTAELALRERVKELQTLRAANRVMNRPDVSLSSRLRELVEIIPDGWLCPEVTEARVIVDGAEVCSEGFRTTPWMQSAEIRPGGRLRGRIDVAVTAPRPEHADVPFPSDEPTLLNSLALALGEAIERNHLTGLLEQTFANLDEAVVITSSQKDGRRIIDANPATERIFGYSRDELVGATSERLHVDREAFHRFAREAAPVLERRGVFTASYPLRRKDGTVVATEQTVTLLDPERGPVGGVVNVVRDVSKRTELEEKLRESQKMEAIGRLAGGIAHDFNNLLTVIRVQTDLMSMDGGSRETADGLRLIQDTTRRAARLTDQLLAFSREQVLEPKLLELGGVVESTTQMLDRLIGDDVVLELQLAADMPPIAVDKSQLEQVIVNLVVNARDAMPDGGRLTITTAAHPIDEDPDVEPGEYAMLRVTDTGTGIDPDALHKIFEPFYSTKAPGKGTGLGLAMAYGFAHQSGGTIRVDSEPGEGTTFELLFPAADRAWVNDEAPPTDGHECESSHRIWLVEDSDAVRRLASRLLQRKGYVIDTFPDAESALAHATSGGEVDVVVTDIGLPGMDGPELAERLRQLRPGLGIVAISGHADGKADRRLPADAEFVRKPFEPTILIEAIRRTLRAADGVPRDR